MATAYLVRTAELAETRELAKQLQGALDSRVLIEEAKGGLPTNITSLPTRRFGAFEVIVKATI